MSEYSFLKPFTFKHQAIQLKNRVVIPPMTTRLSFEDGIVTSDEIRYYQERAGGVGLFITGTANVNPLGKGFDL
ncbi:MAG TPA: NADH-dependent flavin oxidoreductase, partial [Lactobacillus sp.]|nr:NADH-dependent flavin oxidoreductase [Lactobacillus sp.]